MRWADLDLVTIVKNIGGSEIGANGVNSGRRGSQSDLRCSYSHEGGVDVADDQVAIRDDDIGVDVPARGVLVILGLVEIEASREVTAAVTIPSTFSFHALTTILIGTTGVTTAFLVYHKGGVNAFDGIIDGGSQTVGAVGDGGSFEDRVPVRVKNSTTGARNKAVFVTTDNIIEIDIA